MKIFKLHFWYLRTDLVGFSLFRDKVTIVEKTKIVEELAIDKDFDKKRYPTAPQDPSLMTLSDLVSKESFFLLHGTEVANFSNLLCSTESKMRRTTRGRRPSTIWQ